MTKEQADTFVEDEWERIVSSTESADYEDLRRIFIDGVKAGVRLAAHRVVMDLHRMHPDVRVIKVGDKKKTPSELIDDIQNYREDGMAYIASELWEGYD